MSEPVLVKKVYVTKYAHTQGVIVYHDLKMYPDTGSIRVGRLGYFRAEEWFTSPKLAFEDARERIEAKIESHKRAIAKLQSTLELGVPVVTSAVQSDET